MSKKRLIIFAAIIAVGVPIVFAGVILFKQARAIELNEQCINNLRQIDGGKQQWALETFYSKIRPLGRDYSAQFNAVPTVEELIPYLGRYSHPMPQCPRGGKYTIGRVAERPKCSYPGHALPAYRAAILDFLESILIDTHETKELTELVIGMERDKDTPLKCKIGEIRQETRFPSEMRSDLIAELLHRAGLSDSSFPIEGTFILSMGSRQYKWGIRIQNKGAECILTPIR